MNAHPPEGPAAEGPGARPAPPLPLRPAAIGLVALGGAVGTAFRVGITRLGERAVAAPFVTVMINLVGAFLLGLLLERLARGGPDHGRRRRVRLLLGTGALGGFTTYSSLAVDTVMLGGRGQLGAATVVGLGTLLLGMLATAGGIALGSARGSAAGTGEDAAGGETGGELV